MRNILFILSLFVGLTVSAQHKITGVVYNEDKEALVSAMVVLLDKDSTMVTYALSDENGGYAMSDVASGSYILQATYVSYADNNTAVEVSGDATMDITMKASVAMLKEVKITAEHIPMGVRGDTVTYNATAFKTRPNAVVEDLLRKLPGIQVDKNGTIKAYGKEVKNVYVEGKEFFGDDPKMATRNLSAESIDKVEVYDKLSEEEAFTGITSGKENKAINLKLKEGYKNRGFGTVEADAGTSKQYNGKLNYFRYSPKFQLGTILSGNNINSNTYSIQDKLGMMGNDVSRLLKSGMLQSDPASIGDGQNASTSSGLNLRTDFSEKTSLSAHYMFNRNKNTLDRKSIREKVGNGYRYMENEKTDARSKRGNHMLHTKLEYKPSRDFHITWDNDADLHMADANTNALNKLVSANKTTKITRAHTSSNVGMSWQSRLLLKNRMKKRGRSLVTEIAWNHHRNTQDNRVHNTQRHAGSVQEVNQNQKYASRGLVYGINTRYREPIGRRVSLGLSYGFTQENERPSKKFYDRKGSSWILNSGMSSDFAKKFHFQKAGVSLHTRFKKVNLEAGLQGQLSNLSRGVKDARRTKTTFKHVLPSLSMSYAIGKSSNMDLSYRTKVDAPSLQQLMPVLDNTDPNMQYVGNPLLKPSYTHSVSASYDFYDAYRFSNIYVHVQSDLSRNRVVNSIATDSSLVQKITPVNAGTHSSTTGMVGYTSPIRALGVVLDVSGGLSHAAYDNYINTKKEDVIESSAHTRVSVRNKKHTWYSIEAGIGGNFTRARYATSSALNQNFGDVNAFVNTDVQLGSWNIGTDLDYTRYTTYGSSRLPSRLLWNASVKKAFFNNKLELRLTAHDLLNNNRGVKRQAVGSGVSQDTYKSIGRYIMIGASYKIGKG